MRDNEDVKEFYLGISGEGRKSFKDIKQYLYFAAPSFLIIFMIEIEVKKFNELSLEELYSLLQLRSEVFIIEQDCVYQDLDGKDYKSLHVIAKENNKIIACLGFSLVTLISLFIVNFIKKRFIKNSKPTVSYGGT